MLQRAALTMLTAFALLACGGGDPAIDATPPIDAEPPDAPPPDACVENPSCSAATCDDVSGSYNTCATCPIVGMVGPFATTVSQCGCSLDGCIEGNCGLGCADGNTVTWSAMVMGVALNCTGTVSGGTGDFDCTSGVGDCTASWIAPDGTCP